MIFSGYIPSPKLAQTHVCPEQQGCSATHTNLKTLCDPKTKLLQQVQALRRPRSTAAKTAATREDRYTCSTVIAFSLGLATSR